MRRWGWMGLVLAMVPGGGATALSAQDTASGMNNGRLRVFFDCNAIGCDFTYYRREIPWVDWVRDREDADVHLLITFESSGGGFSYDLSFIGLEEFGEQEHNLTAFSSSTDTADERRELLRNRISLGLAPFVAQTDEADRLVLQFADPGEEEAEGSVPTPTDDPWDLWVFNVGLGGGLDAQSTIENKNVNGSVSADRVSEDWKLSWDARMSYREQEFELSDDETIVSIRRSMSTSAEVIRSLGPRWGAGLFGGVSSATFQNHDIRFNAAPAIEFNIFPYDESSRRELRLQYRPTTEYVRYDEITVFDKEEEWTYRHRFSINLDFTQPWGSAGVGGSASAFMDDLEKNSLSFFGNVSIRIVRGLRLRIFGGASRIRDRINLPASEATEEDILLRQRILDTSFSANLNVSLNFRFGSIFNNIVNPRFGGGGGGFFF